MKYLLILISAVCLGVLGAIVFFYKKPQVVIIQPTPTPITTSGFNLSDAPSDSLKGVATISGEVNWLSRTATQSAKLTADQTISQGEKIETANSGVASIEFTGLMVTLFENSSLDIIQTLPANLVFSQNAGSAQYTKTGIYPVTVRSQHLLIQVEGDVKVVIKDAQISITGPVTVAYNNSRNISQVVKSKNQLVFNDDTRRVVVK